MVIISKQNRKDFKNFLRDIVLSDNTVSAKRAITLAFAIHLILITFGSMILLPVAIFMIPKGNLELIKIIIAFNTDIIDKSFYIIMAGLGVMGGVDIAGIIANRNNQFPDMEPK